MQLPDPPAFDELIRSSRHSAIHLEMRDVYGIANEAERIARWRAGFRDDPANREAWWRPFHDTIADAVARGVTVRRARVVSEPLSEYIRYAHSGTFKNLLAGEQVRWLPRAMASDLLLPGNDVWVFDAHTARFGIFAGDGTLIRNEINRETTVIRSCIDAFEAVWDRAIPHHEYTAEGL